MSYIVLGNSIDGILGNRKAEVCPVILNYTVGTPGGTISFFLQSVVITTFADRFCCCFLSLLFYAIATIFQLYLGGEMMHEMRR